MEFTTLANQESLSKTVASLSEHGINTTVVENGQEALKKVMELIPRGASVMAMSSQTLNQTGIDKAIDESETYISVKKQLNSMNRQTQDLKMRGMGAAPEWTIGSVHAVTEDGSVLIASNTGSQIPAYAYGAQHVIWIVGTHKIVKNFDEGIKRLYEHSLPLESVRVQKAYGMPSSAINKILVINKEVTPGRITLIFVKEQVGF